MGFFPSHQGPNRLQVQLKILLYLLPPISYFISSVVFLLTTANSIQDYTLSILMTTSIFTCVSYIVVMISNMPQILEVIEKFEKTIENSECNKMKQIKTDTVENLINTELFQFFIDRNEWSHRKIQIWPDKRQNRIVIGNLLLYFGEIDHARNHIAIISANDHQLLCLWFTRQRIPFTITNRVRTVVLDSFPSFSHQNVKEKITPNSAKFLRVLVFDKVE